MILMLNTIYYYDQIFAYYLKLNYLQIIHTTHQRFYETYKYWNAFIQAFYIQGYSNKQLGLPNSLETNLQLKFTTHFSRDEGQALNLFRFQNLLIMEKVKNYLKYFLIIFPNFYRNSSNLSYFFFREILLHLQIYLNCLEELNYAPQN